VVGSTSTGEDSQLQHWDVIIDALGTLPSISDYFRSAWKEQGWEVGEWDLFGHGFDEAGFLPNPSSPGIREAMLEMIKARANRPGTPSHLMLCRDSVRLRVMLSGRSLYNGTMEVRLDIHRYTSHGSCDEKLLNPMGAIQNLTPKLYPPVGVSVSQGGGSSGTNNWNREATAVTNMSAQALEVHYEKQLDELGWTKLEGDAVSSMAWSKWSIPHKDKAQGFLYVIRGPHEQARLLHIGIEMGLDYPWASHGDAETVYRVLGLTPPPTDERPKAKDEDS
jgi:hypothetical protein